MNLLQKVKSHLINLPGWRTKRKIVVFESDDWGAVRMPGLQAYQGLLNNGIRVDKSKYDSLDCLEQRSDIEGLGNTLQRYQDRNGSPPVFTTNMVMGNPDYQAIKDNNFSKYVHEPFQTSYAHYYGQNLRSVWTCAFDDHVFYPQFHAREHLNTQLWMRDLQSGVKDTRLAFNYNFYGLKTKTSSPNQKNYLAAYYTDSMNELKHTQQIFNEGLEMFKENFGFSSKTFTPCNYVWPKELEHYLHEQGILNYQTQAGNIQPQPQKGGKRRIRRMYTGMKNKHNQKYTVRNVHFEPYLYGDLAVDIALKGMQRAFFWNKPAIICTHRINYVSGMSIKHRDNNLRRLDELLYRISKAYPEIEYLHSASLAELMHGKDQ